MKHARAFSIIEVIVVLGIFTMVMTMIVNSVLTFYRANTSSFEEAVQVQNAERGIQVLVHDLRESTYGDDGSYPLASIASSSITFYSDVDRTSPVEKIRYELKNTSLYRSVLVSSGTPPKYVGAAATSTVSNYVRNFGDAVSVFRYYDASSTEIVDPAQIAKVVSVTISLVVDVTPLHAPGEFTLRSSATLRNLRPQ